MNFEVMDYFVIIILLLCFLAIYYMYINYKLCYWRQRGVISPKTHFIFGNFKDLFTFKKSPGQILQEMYENAEPNEPYVGFYIFHEPKLLLRDLKLMKQIIVKDFDVFSNRGFGGKTQKDSLGLINLLSVHQPPWKYLRQKLTPGITGSKLYGMVPLITRCTVPMLKFMDDAKCESDGYQILELKEFCSRYVNDVIASLAFGVTTNSFDENCLSFWQAGIKIMTGLKRGIILMIVFLLPRLIKYIEPFTTGQDKYFRNIFLNTLMKRERSGIERGDIIDHFVLLKNGEQRSDFNLDVENLYSQAMSFYIAGYEACTTIIAYTLYELAYHPAEEDRLYKEIMETLRGKELNADLINQMDFLDQVVNEILRMYPPLPMIDRVATKDYKLPESDLIIQEGTGVYISVAATNRDPNYYHRPNEFIPTRPRIQIKDFPRFSLTFGMGPRSCIGQKLGLLITKVAIISIVREYKLEKMTKRDSALVPFAVFTSAANGLHIKLKRRN